MPVLKSRPQVRVRLPAVVRPKQTFTISVLVDAKRPVDVDFVQVSLVGTEKVTTGFGNSQASTVRNVLSLRAQLLGRGQLPAGRSTYDCQVSLPLGAPPSYAGRQARIAYEVHVHASIPWWPDVRASFDVKVGHALTEDPPAAPVIYSSAPHGPKAREGFLEVSLPVRAVAVGDALQGAVALGNVAWNRYRALKLTLVGTERLRDRSGAPTSSEVSRYEAELPVSSAGPPIEGQAIPFSFRLPAGATPTTHTSSASGWTLEWRFEVRALVRFGADVVVAFPLTLLPARPGGPTSRHPAAASTPRFAPPTVGSQRVQELWRAAAQITGLELRDETLTGAAGDVRIVMRREHRGERGLFLVAELRYPPFGLGLRREERLLRGAAITGRDARQVNAFVSRIGAWLRPFTLTALDDRQLTVDVRDAGHNRARLVAVARDVLTLARAVADAHTAVLPPPLMADAVPAWTALAAELGGTLQRGCMAVSGQFEGHAAEVRTEWRAADQPDRTVVELVPRAPLAITEQAPLRDDARALAERLAGDARSFSLSAERLTVILDAPLADPGPARDALRRMTRLCALLQPMAGIYR